MNPFKVGDIVYASVHSIFLFLDNEITDLSDILMVERETIGIVIEITPNLEEMNFITGKRFEKGREGKLIKVFTPGGIGWIYSILLEKLN